MDPRQRAPFAHQSSSVDLASQWQHRSHPNTPPHQPYSNLLHPNLDAYPSLSNSNAVKGGPGYFGPVPPAPISASTRLQNAASGLFTSVKMDRKDSNDPSNGLAYAHTNGNGNGYPFANGHAHSRSHGRRASFDDLANSASSIVDTLKNSFLSLTKMDADQLSRNLPSGQTVKFVFLCFLWYFASAVSSNTGKVILNNFKFPVTLTIVQFAFVAGLCWIGSRRELGLTSRLRTPTKAILLGTLPMAAFQVTGHIFGSLAISRVPVSTVHTIKALSPMVTVLAYAVLFGVKYSPATYISILPLTLGVMLAVSFDISLSNFFGLVCAFGSTLVFVSQNIFFKKVMPSSSSNTADSAHGSRLDKINLLYFSSGMAFLLMIPIWLYSDAGRLVHLWFHPGSFPTKGDASSTRVFMYFIINGTVHFAQNVLAFAILASTSPVTYSIASLVKRIAVICLAIVWFKQSVHAIQAVGILLTAVGLYMYNNAKRDVEKGEKKMRQVEAVRDGMLPSNITEKDLLEGRFTPVHQYGMKINAHPSPRPSYSVDFESVSKSSALPRPPVAFSHPPLNQGPPRAKVIVKPANHTGVQNPEELYPSPPASTASSPPLPPMSIRRRSNSIDRPEFSTPPSVVVS